MEHCVTHFVPISRKRSKGKPWITKEVNKARRKKYQLWKKYQETKDYNIYVRYKKQLNFTTREIRNAKKSFEKKVAENIKLDPKSYHSYVKSKTKTKDRIGPLVDETGSVVTSDKEAADLLNVYFTSVFTVEDKTEIPVLENILEGGLEAQLDVVKFPVSLVLEKLNRLKPGKSPGVDNISTLFLKNVCNEVDEPLNIIFTKSMESGQILLDWKRANVSPVFKKGKRSSPTNYRPISLTSHVSKVMESIIRDAIMKHMSKYELIRESQHGLVGHV